MSWLAPVTGRFAFVVHRVSGHRVTWNSALRGAPACAGDIVCHDCGQVLWCRGHDPWRATGVDSRPDHWGATHKELPPQVRFENLQQILRLAGNCPDGNQGDDIRRMACELIEAGSRPQRLACRRRLLTCIAHAEWRRSHGRSLEDDPGEKVLNQLASALLSEAWGDAR